jgi:hypothetical protein
MSYQLVEPPPGTQVRDRYGCVWVNTADDGPAYRFGAANWQCEDPETGQYGDVESWNRVNEYGPLSLAGVPRCEGCGTTREDRHAADCKVDLDIKLGRTKPDVDDLQEEDRVTHPKYGEVVITRIMADDGTACVLLDPDRPSDGKCKQMIAVVALNLLTKKPTLEDVLAEHWTYGIDACKGCGEPLEDPAISNTAAIAHMAAEIRKAGLSTEGERG